MGAIMRLSEAAREKLMKEAELYEQTCCFIINFKPTKVLDYAYKNIYSVYHDLDVILSSPSSSSPLVDDVSSMIIKNRSTIENELVYICDRSYAIETQQAFKEFLVHFKQGDLTKYGSMVTDSRYDDIIPSNCKRDSKENKEKAPQLTKQQEDAQEKHFFNLEKLYSESELYHLTLRFMLSFLDSEQVTTKEQRKLLVSAYQNVMAVHFDFRRYIRSHEDFSDKDVSLILSEYRSKVENELQGICDNVSNLIVQEAYSRYLDDFKTGLKHSPQDHLSYFQNEDGKIMSSKPKISIEKKKKKKSKLRLRGKGGSRSCKTPSLFDLDMINYFRVPRVNHSKCCMKNDLETSDLEWEDPRLLVTWAKESSTQEAVPLFDDDSF